MLPTISPVLLPLLSLLDSAPLLLDVLVLEVEPALLSSASPLLVDALVLDVSSALVLVGDPLLASVSLPESGLSAEHATSVVTQKYRNTSRPTASMVSHEWPPERCRRDARSVASSPHQRW